MRPSLAKLHWIGSVVASALPYRRAAEKVGEARPEKAQKPEQNLPVPGFRFERIVTCEILVDDRQCVFLSWVRLDCREQQIFEVLAREPRRGIEHPHRRDGMRAAG